MESVRHHAKEEEHDLFPKVRAGMTRSELEDLGALLVRAKKGAPSRPHPRSSDTPPGNVAASLMAPLDAAADKVGSTLKRVRAMVR